MVVIMVFPFGFLSDCSRCFLLLAAIGSGNPHALKVPCICSSSCLLSVTITIGGLPNLYISCVASHNMERDFPEPCVCHIIPPLSVISLLRSSLSTALFTTLYC